VRKSHLTLQATCLLIFNDKPFTFVDYLKFTDCLPSTVTHCRSLSGTVAHSDSQSCLLSYVRSVCSEISTDKWIKHHLVYVTEHNGCHKDPDAQLCPLVSTTVLNLLGPYVS